MRSSARFGSVLAAACLTPALVIGSAAAGRAGHELPPAERHRDRPPPAHTGGFSEPTCHACHFAADVNAGAGALTIAGLPAEYDAGAAYALTITIAQHGLAAGGFQMSARFDDGRQAGHLAPQASDAARVDVTTLADVHYIHHSSAGAAAAAPDSAQWRVVWTAPASGGAVVFHIAANAADDDASPLGDFIYATSRRTTPGK